MYGIFIAILSEIDPCKEIRCPINSVCRKTGPGFHKFVCRQGYTGDGVICSGNNNIHRSDGHDRFTETLNYKELHLQLE